jgi:hypothetical protein
MGTWQHGIDPSAGMTGDALSLLLAPPVRLRKEATRGPVDSCGVDQARTAYIRVTCWTSMCLPQEALATSQRFKLNGSPSM